VVVFDGKLFLAYVGTNGRLNVECSTNGVVFGDKVTLGAISDFSPTMAAFDGGPYISWAGTDSRLCFESTANGVAFSNEVMLDATAR
jgi:hypothetical protein